jgi:pimeloyl-ACP methyl ester carboxylesterase
MNVQRRFARMMTRVHPLHAIGLLGLAGIGGGLGREFQPETLPLAPCRVPNVSVEIRCGTYWVYEDRLSRRGRKIPLLVRVIPAESPHPSPDPMVFVSPGGPGTTNSEAVPGAYVRGWRRDRDVVLVDLRGTSGPNRLDCKDGASPEHPARYLQSPFDTATVRACRVELETRADLRFYTTRFVIDDLHDALVALGYGKVNLWGASGGTREVLEYLRHHGSSVRSAIIEGTAPVAFKNPLPHAAAAQEALDSLFAQCANDTACKAAYPDLRNEFNLVLARLVKAPIRTRIPPELGGLDSAVEIDQRVFAEGIRGLSYAVGSERTIPYLVHHAATGDFAPFVVSAVGRSRGTHDGIRFGFLLSQTCTEDVPRITAAEIGRETANTYLGDVRVRAQQAACALWPRGKVSAGDFEPVRSDVPVFLLAGTIDPVTPPRFAVDAARYLKNSVVVIAPGGHVPGGACISQMEMAFLARPVPDSVDVSCVRTMTLPPFKT